MEIKHYGVGLGVVFLFMPMPRPIALGDTFRMYRGCDKTLGNCRDIFNNIVNRQAEDYIPGTDAITQSPNAKT